MKTFAFVFAALLACVVAYDVELRSEQDWKNLLEDESINPEELGIILNGQGKRVVKNLLKQMPCGWPEYGIPPLAPYTNGNLEINLAKSVVETILQMIKFRFDGLNEMEIKQLKVSYTFNKKVKYHFNFPRLEATAHNFNSQIFIDLMKELGLSVRYEGSGAMDFSLENLSIQGQFKYKMPLFWGSVKIYNFECVITLGGVRSNLGGILGNGKLNELLNDRIELEIPAFINGNQKEISQFIEETVVPIANEKLEGKKVWFVLETLANSNPNCIAQPAPWLLEN